MVHPQPAGHQITSRRQLTNFQVPTGSDPVQKFLEIDHAELMRDAGIQVDVQSVYGIYVAALPSEYELEIRELNRNQVMDRNEIINLVQAQYDLRGKKKKSSPAAHALVVDGAVGPGGVDTLAVSEGVEETGVATTATERSRSPATETTAPRTTSSRPKG